MRTRVPIAVESAVAVEIVIAVAVVITVVITESAVAVKIVDIAVVATRRVTTRENVPEAEIQRVLIVRLVLLAPDQLRVVHPEMTSSP